MSHKYCRSINDVWLFVSSPLGDKGSSATAAGCCSIAVDRSAFVLIASRPMLLCYYIIYSLRVTNECCTWENKFSAAVVVIGRLSLSLWLILAEEISLFIISSRDNTWLTRTLCVIELSNGRSILV